MTDIIDLMQSTVKIEQSIGNGLSVSGTAFVVAASAPDGSPRLILVSANHVFGRMPGDKMRVGFRNWSPDHGWKYAPAQVRIRGAAGEPLWTRHPTQDIAALRLPNGVITAAIPISELPGERALEKLQVQPGDEMMVLGFPRGIAANDAGFPILRSGKVASYPLSPADRYPTYLVDFDVFAGNSGGPVYIRGSNSRLAATVVITGMLTQQIKYREQRLAIGNVTQADFISETVSLTEGGATVDVSPASPGSRAPTIEGDHIPASAPERSPQDRLREAWAALKEDIRILCKRIWIVFRDWKNSITTPDAHRIVDNNKLL